MNKRIFTLVVGLLFPFVLFPSVFINEMMVKNVSSHVNENFNFEGWVELYNSGTEPVDLSNYFFSESSSDPTMWQFEGDMTIAPNGYAVFYFDELDTLNHASFKLDSDGGKLYLNDASGNLVDAVSYPKPIRNASYGRVNDGEESFGYLLSSTILASNNGVKVASKQTAAPVFSREGGFYNAPVSVELTMKNGEPAKIYYTTDGSEPTASSPVYSSPIQISKVTPLRAVAMIDGEVASTVSTATYFIGVDDIPTNTKIVSLSTDRDYVYGDSMGILVIGKNGLTVPSKCGSTDRKANYMNDWDRPCNFELFDEDNVSQVNQEVKIGVFGACSRTKAIKSLKVKANKTFGNNKIDYPIFSEKPSLKWKSVVLRNSGNDFGRMLFRDAFLQTLAVSGMDIDHQAYEPSVVFLNGEYYGMLGIRERTNKDFVYSNYGLDEEEFCIEETQKKAVECNEFNELLELAKSDPNAPDFYSKMDEIIDVEEFLNYFMTQIYYCNQDWSEGNNKAWKRLDGGKWRWILYDVDYTTSLYGNYMQTNGFSYAAKCGYFSRFIKNSEVKRRLMTKFVAHAGTTFEPQNVSYFMDSMIANVEPEADYYFDFLLKKKKNEVSSWRDEAEKVRNFVANRKDYVMGHVKDSLKLGQPLPIRIYSDIEGSGFVLNDLENIHRKDFRSYYFTGSEITVEPIVPDGYRFKNWEVRQETDLLKTSDTWKYLYQKESVDPAWKRADYVDSAWVAGAAPLGSGLSYYHKTTVSSSSSAGGGMGGFPGGGLGGIGGGGFGDWGGGFGGFGGSVNTTTYFRKEIVIDDVSVLGENLKCLAHINDGAIIYVNGTEVFRFNLPDGQVDDTIPAILEMDSYATLRFDVPRSLLNNGKNVLAVELHSADGSSSIVFDMSLFDSQTGSVVTSTSNSFKYAASVNGELALKAVYEKDPDWSPSDVKLFINEVCASNNQYVDEFREDDDWIEIYNDGTSPVDLGGMYISDKRKNLTRFQIPTGQPEKTTVPAKGYLVIWADADSSAQGPLHTNFKLSKSSSQTISLSRMEDGELVVLDSIRYVNHVSGQTCSRFSYSGDGAWCITSRPTFAAKNAYFPVETEGAGGEENGETTYDALAEAEGGAVQVYPNPAEDYLWFSFAEEESAIISISDVTGRVLVRKRVDTGESVYVGDLSRGTYIVDVKTEEKQFSVKIIKP